MKKRIFALMLCVAFVCMAGAALAETIHVLTDESDLKMSGGVQFVADGSVKALEVTASDDVTVAWREPIYRITPMDAQGNVVEASGALYIPYPDRMTQENKAYFKIRFNRYEGEAKLQEHEAAQMWFWDTSENDTETFTPYGIRLKTNLAACENILTFDAFVDSQLPSIQWATLMGRLYKKIEKGEYSDSDKLEYAHFEEFELDDKTYGVTATYNEITNTTTIAGKTDAGYSGGRISGVRLATYEWAGQGEQGEQVFKDWNLNDAFGQPTGEQASFLLDSGTYVFKDVLLTSDYLDIWACAGQNYKVVLEESVKGIYDAMLPGSKKGGFTVKVMAENGANVELENHTTIASEFDHSLNLSVMNGTSFTLKGKGEILAGRGNYYWVREVNGREQEITVEDDRPLSMEMWAYADTNEEAIDLITKTLKDIKLDRKQFEDYGDGFANTRLSRMKADRESFDIEGEITHGSVHAHRNDLLFSNANNPVLVYEDGDVSGMTLRCEALKYDDDYIQYDIMLIGENTGKMASLEKKGGLFIPYPDGMDLEEAKKISFTVRHYTFSNGVEGEEIYATDDGTLEYTPYGLFCEVGSFSPFMMNWQEKPMTDSLPETGDNGQLTLWFAMLCMTGMALMFLRKRTHN